MNDAKYIGMDVHAPTIRDLATHSLSSRARPTLLLRWCVFAKISNNGFACHGLRVARSSRTIF